MVTPEINQHTYPSVSGIHHICFALTNQFGRSGQKLLPIEASEVQVSALMGDRQLCFS